MSNVITINLKEKIDSIDNTKEYAIKEGFIYNIYTYYSVADVWILSRKKFILDKLVREEIKQEKIYIMRC
ncbi:hypothetical protein [Romboutsia timonensis]|uniref:hypothetical protein n=1 Tax=Romboutsia timonensis TaxID=1776391 RepID=UPI0023F67480|nr:hypothetical protein [Romboutsia timonensis]